jgi:hypothetical protein
MLPQDIKHNISTFWEGGGGNLQAMMVIFLKMRKHSSQLSKPEGANEMQMKRVSPVLQTVHKACIVSIAEYNFSS